MNIQAPLSDDIDGNAALQRGGGGRVLVGVVGFAFFVDMLAYGIVVPVLPSLAKSAGLDYSGVGALFACYGVTYLILTPVAGWLVNARGTRSVFLSGAIILTLATLIFGYAGSLPGLVTSRVLQGAGATMTWVSGQTILLEMFPSDQRGRVVGTASIGTALGALLGPAAGGLLLDIGGAHAPFLLAAGMACAAVLTLMAALPRSMGNAERTAKRVPSCGRGTPKVAVPWLLAALAAGLAFGAVEATLPIDIVARLHVSGATIGSLFALTAAVFVATSLTAGWRSDGGRRAHILVAGWATLGIALAVIGLPSTVALQAVSLAFLAFGLGTMNATIMPGLAYVMDTIGTQRAGTTAAAYNLSLSAGSATGALLAGWVAAVGTFRAATLVIALTLVACGVLAVLAHKAFARHRTA